MHWPIVGDYGRNVVGGLGVDCGRGPFVVDCGRGGLRLGMQLNKQS